MKNMFDIGMTVKEISTVMDVRYNFVYNVVSNYVNMNKIELVAEEKNVKKDLIIAMYLNGKTNKEISIELSTNYNYVHNVLKTYKLQNVVTEQKESDEQQAQ
jgi:transposase